MKKLALLIFTFFGCSGVALGVCENEEGVQRIDNGNVQIVVSENEVNIQLTNFNEKVSAKRGWWGVENRTPVNLISNMRVNVGEEIYVPLSAYSDLANPLWIRFDEKAGAWVLTIRGGGVASLYEASLVFKNGDLIKRKVFSCSFPDERWEETTYSWIEDRGQ